MISVPCVPGSMRSRERRGVEGMWAQATACRCGHRRATSCAGMVGVLRAVAVPPVTGEGDPLALTRARRGDEGAFADVVRHHEHRLRSPASRLLGDRNRMDDVLQDVYGKDLRSLPRFRGASTLGTWLSRITCYAPIDGPRLQPTITAEAFGADREASIADPTPGPAEIVVEHSDLATGRKRLLLGQRAALMLVDTRGLDNSEAAEVVGVARTALRATVGGATA
jgi:RNA polymerase sigma-70 factor (ECF subfamily)